ncbi:MAG: molybdenum cofactor guanylyltransferase [Bacteroidota bacterium]|nr:molybdenum cofactor guanylyltransferase [Bacteroidota bacterium]
MTAHGSGGKSHRESGMKAFPLQAVLLVGGRSRRMGRDKALLTVGDEYFITRIVRCLSAVAGPPLLSSSHAQQYTFLHLQHCPDLVADGGPLAGLHAALHGTKAERLLLAPCDLPFLTTAALRCLLDHADDAAVVYAADADGVQPLLGVYHRSILPVLEDYLHSGRRSAQRFLNSCDAHPLRLDLHIPAYDSATLRNINTPADLRAVANRM